MDLAFGKNRALYHATLQIIADTGSGWALSMFVSINHNWPDISLICGDYSVYLCALHADRGNLIALKSSGGRYKHSETVWHASKTSSY